MQRLLAEDPSSLATALKRQARQGTWSFPYREYEQVICWCPKPNPIKQCWWIRKACQCSMRHCCCFIYQMFRSPWNSGGLDFAGPWRMKSRVWKDCERCRAALLRCHRLSRPIVDVVNTSIQAYIVVIPNVLRLETETSGSLLGSTSSHLPLLRHRLYSQMTGFTTLERRFVICRRC